MMAQTHEGGWAYTHGRWAFCSLEQSSRRCNRSCCAGRALVEQHGVTAVAGLSGSDVDDRESQIVTNAPGHSGKPRESLRKGYCRHQSSALQGQDNAAGLGDLLDESLRAPFRLLQVRPE